MANGLTGTAVGTLTAEDLLNTLRNTAGARDEKWAQILAEFERAGVRPAQAEAQQAETDLRAMMAEPAPDVDPNREYAARLVGVLSDVLTQGKSASELIDNTLRRQREQMLAQRQERLALQRGILEKKLARATQLGDVLLQEKTLGQMKQWEKESETLNETMMGIYREQQETERERLRQQGRGTALDREQAIADRTLRNLKIGALMTDADFKKGTDKFLENIHQTRGRRKKMTREEARNNIPQLAAAHQGILRSEVDNPMLTIRRWKRHNKLMDAIEGPKARGGGFLMWGAGEAVKAYITYQEARATLEAFYGGRTGEADLPREVWDAIEQLPGGPRAVEAQ